MIRLFSGVLMCILGGFCLGRAVWHETLVMTDSGAVVRDMFQTGRVANHNSTELITTDGNDWKQKEAVVRQDLEKFIRHHRLVKIEPVAQVVLVKVESGQGKKQFYVSLTHKNHRWKVEGIFSAD